VSPSCPRTSSLPAAYVESVLRLPSLQHIIFPFSNGVQHHLSGRLALCSCVLEAILIKQQIQNDDALQWQWLYASFVFSQRLWSSRLVDPHQQKSHALKRHTALEPAGTHCQPCKLICRLFCFGACAQHGLLQCAHRRSFVFCRTINNKGHVFNSEYTICNT